jgi:hypothetical protein
MFLQCRYLPDKLCGVTSTAITDVINHSIYENTDQNRNTKWETRTNFEGEPCGMLKNMMFTPTHIKKRGKIWQELETARL